MPTTQKQPGLTDAFHRYQERLRDRLEAAYLLQEDPFEPEEAGKDIHLLLVLSNLHPESDYETVSEIAGEWMERTGYQVGLVAHATEAGSDVAEWARKEGMLL